jgi:hypothetical protein
MSRKERHPLVVEQIGRRQRRLAIVQLGKGHLRGGIEEGLQVNPASTFNVPTKKVSCAPPYPGPSLSNSPWASFSPCAFSKAAS